MWMKIKHEMLEDIDQQISNDLLFDVVGHVSLSLRAGA